MILTRTILKDFVESWRITTKIKNVVDLGNNTYQIEFCNPYHLRVGSEFEIGSNTYVVTGFSGNTFTVEGAALPVESVAKLATPHFFYNTVREQNSELSQIQFPEDKYPFIWVHDAVTDTGTFNDSKPVSRYSNLRIFFLDNSDWSSWNNEKHYTDSIQQMANLAEFFIEKAKKNRGIFGELKSDYTLKYYARFGESYEGRNSNLFNSLTSGVELAFDLPIKRNFVNCSQIC